MISKKAQQEMIGFILIILLVVIGMVVALVINLNNSKEIKTNELADNLMNSIKTVTTSCKIREFSSYKTVQELSKSCNNNENCINGGSACFVLNQTLTNILINVLSLESQITKIEYKIINKKEEIEENQIFVSLGNCTGIVYSSEPFTYWSNAYSNEELTARLHLCIDN